MSTQNRKEYALGAEARKAMIEVAENIRGIVGKTLGPAGRNYMIPSGITNDGATIVSHIRFPDECKDNIAMGFEEIAIRADKQGGDGTTSAIVMGTTAVITIAEDIPDLDAPTPGGKSVMDIMRAVDEEKDKVLAALAKRAKPVKTLEELEQVAFTSMENMEIAKIVAKTMWDAGKDALTAVDDGYTGKVETSVMSGLQSPITLAAPFMLNSGHFGRYENCDVLVANHDFEAYKELTPFMQTLINHAKATNRAMPLVIVARSFSTPFVKTVANVWQQSNGGLKIILLSGKNLSDDDFADIAAFTGANLIDTGPRKGGRMDKARHIDCGYIGKLESGKETILLDGRGDTGTEGCAVDLRVKALESRLGDEKDSLKRKDLERRIGRLKGGIATIYVDAQTAVEKYYLKLKIQDAMNSCKAALEGGMLPGGGVTLDEIAEELGEDAYLYEALKYPHECIKLNAGGKIKVPKTVQDSYLVVKSSVENAISGAKLLLTVEGVIADTPQDLVDQLGTRLSAQAE